MPDTWADLLKLALAGLGGGGAIKVGPMVVSGIRTWSTRKSKDERQREKTDKEDRAAIDITDQLRELARDAVAEVRLEIAAEREKTKAQGLEIVRLTKRVGQLEKVIVDAHLEVPAEV